MIAFGLSAAVGLAVGVLLVMLLGRVSPGEFWDLLTSGRVRFPSSPEEWDELVDETTRTGDTAEAIRNLRKPGPVRSGGTGSRD